MKDLYIIGAGSVGGHIAMNFSEYEVPYRLSGFFDDAPSKIGGSFCGYPVIGPVDELLKLKDVAVVIGIAFPRIKKKIYAKLSNNNDFEYPTLVSPSAWISAGVTLGQGTVIYPGSSINYGSSIGDFVVMNMNCAIGHDCQIDSFSSFAPGVNLGGRTTIGNGVDMGIGSATKQSVKIGDCATIGGQAMIIQDVLEKEVVIGVPGKPKA